MRKLTDDELSRSSSSDSDLSATLTLTSSPSSSPSPPATSVFGCLTNSSGGGGSSGTYRMAAKAVLTCRPNSHPFQERTLILDQPAKIGRSVARARPGGNNAIFDCKVLSRNHALLWHENGKFYLQDTKSSNGTFVNNQRLSKSSEESAPREVCSGDIVQFGVDVMEVNKKLTHGCIVANLQLFLPDGKEAKASSSTTLTDKASNLSLQEIYLLSHYMKDAMQKEQLIEHKLAAIRKLVTATTESMANSWKALIEEDRLLTRIDILERQVETSHKSMTEDKLKEEVYQLHEDKDKYQSVAKEALRKSMQEKMDISKKFHDLEKVVQNCAKETELYKQLSEQRSDELQDLAEKFETSEKKSKELEEELSTQTLKYKDDLDDVNKKLQEGEDQLTEKQKLVEDLLSQMDKTETQLISAGHNELAEMVQIKEENIESEVDNVNMLNDGIPTNNRTGEIEGVTVQLNAAEVDKNEIQSRMLQMLTLFEDLKSVSNKIQTSEYLSELVGKVYTEINQLKNVIQSDEPMKNSYSITEKLNEINVENHGALLSSETSNGIEKLLEDSRETIKALQLENSSVRRKHETVQDKLNASVHDVEKLQKQMEAVSESNLELKSQVAFLQEKLAASDKAVECNQQKMKKQTDFIKSLEGKGELRALERHKISSPPLGITISDLNTVTPSEKVVGTEESLIDSMNSSMESNTCVSISSTSFSDEDVRQQLLMKEEELAVYKHRFSQSFEEKNKLERENVELRSKQDSFADQSKMIRYIGPIIVILILAILIAMRPST